jgi:mono/diheme cytochrome c family protein
MKSYRRLHIMRFIATIVLTLAAVKGETPAAPPTEQITRGQELFLKSPKGVACGTCHTMAGIGTAVGPDLKQIASLAMPRGLVMAIRMTSTETVQFVTPAGARAGFPARVVDKQGGAMKLWNLSTTPPVLVTLQTKDVKSIDRDQTWKHPPASAGYSANELADLVGFLRWAATGNAKPVTVDEVGSTQ